MDTNRCHARHMNTALGCMFFVTLTIATTVAATDRIYTLLVPKPQGFYQNNYIRPHDDTLVRSAQPSILSGTVAYRHSFRSRAIAQAIFGGTQIPFVGSNVASFNPATDVLADNVGLAQDFQGTLCVEPVLQTVTVDGFYHLDLSCWSDALYIEIGLPLVAARWDLRHGECIQNAGTLTFPAGYMGTASTATARSIQQAMSGFFFFGDMQVPWTSNRLACSSRNLTRLPDLSLAFGSVVLETDAWTLRLAALTLMPGGNKYSATWILTPLIGTGDHWELGGSIIATFRHTWETCRSFEATLMGNVTHLFDSHQNRTFDLVGQGRLSRYALLKQYSFTGSPAMLTYDGIMISAGNFTTRRCEVACAVQGDVTLQGRMQYDGLILDGGYNFYGRMRERVEIVCTDVPCTILGKFYQIKGTAPIVPPSTSRVLTIDDIDLATGTAPSSIVNTVFLQAGYCWHRCWGEPTLLVGAEGEFGTYGSFKALSQWGVWTNFCVRF